jgi:DNA-directed RNA polymerase sigma subunit (sigma70/sigma32)
LKYKVGALLMGIQDDFEHTIVEISEELDISREKCRQILLMALKKLKSSKYEKNFDEIKDIFRELENDKL